MIEHRDLGLLQCCHHLGDRLRRVDVDDRGQRVDEEADHRRGVVEVGGSSGHRLAEGDDAFPRHPGQQHRPRELQNCRQRRTLRPRHGFEPRDELCVDDRRMVARQRVGGRHRAGRYECRAVDRCEHLTPGRQPRSVIGAGDATREVAEIACPGELSTGVGRPGGVERQQVGQDERARPTVEQDVMVGDHNCDATGVTDRHDP